MLETQSRGSAAVSGPNATAGVGSVVLEWKGCERPKSMQWQLGERGRGCAEYNDRGIEPS